MENEDMLTIIAQSLNHQEKVNVEVLSEPQYDPVAQDHFWIMITSFKVNPDKFQGILDHESIVSISGPGCYFCETLWVGDNTFTKCPGHPVN